MGVRIVAVKSGITGSKKGGETMKLNKRKGWREEDGGERDRLLVGLTTLLQMKKKKRRRKERELE